MTRLEVLKSARAPIAKPEAWCKDAYAKDSTGRLVNARESTAVAWCASGAIDRFDAFDSKHRIALTEVIGSDAIATFNDKVSHPEILAMFDEAIRRAESA